MKKAFIAIVGVLFFFTALPAEVKIGVVNPALILSNLEKGKEAFKRIQNLINQKQAKLAALQNEIDKLNREVNNPALSPEVQQSKGIEMERKKTDLQRSNEDAQREVYLEQQKELEPIQKELVAIIGEIAKNEKFTLIMDLGTTQQNSVSNIVYFDQAIDLSMRVVEIYNQKFPVQPTAKKQEPAKTPAAPTPVKK